MAESKMTERARKAKEVLSDILRLMEIDARVEVSKENDHLLLEIHSKDNSASMGKKAQVLDAMQYLVNRIVSRSHPGDERIIVDAEGYRRRRAEQLKSMAHQVAQRVRDEGVPYAFDTSLNSAERRIVHMELKNEPDIMTKSEGDGERRRLVVYPRSNK